MSSPAGVASLGVVLYTDLVGSTELRSSSIGLESTPLALGDHP
ncbi:MAG TPA: hypothetical protein VGR90_09145 [Acidimicrobiales bacterium]|nr:hypothetical protein [Acidimicrobiales bacterium]